jgi:hypothetical protein
LCGEVTLRVVALIAVCDVVTPMQLFEQLLTQRWSMSQARDECIRPTAGLRFVVREVACTDESRVVPLRERMGWGSRAHRMTDEQQWRHTTADDITRSVLTVVLPDNAEQTGDDHPWSEFVATLAAAGVQTTAAELAALPYNVVLAPQLHDALNGSAPSSAVLTELLDRIP